MQLRHGVGLFILKLWHIDLQSFKLNMGLVEKKNWLTTHGVRLGDEKCGLGSCLDCSSRTRKHLSPVSLALGPWASGRCWDKPSLLLPHLFLLRLPLHQDKPQVHRNPLILLRKGS